MKDGSSVCHALGRYTSTLPRKCGKGSVDGRHNHCTRCERALSNEEQQVVEEHCLNPPKGCKLGLHQNLRVPLLAAPMESLEATKLISSFSDCYMQKCKDGTCLDKDNNDNEQLAQRRRFEQRMTMENYVCMFCGFFEHKAYE